MVSEITDIGVVIFFLILGIGIFIIIMENWTKSRSRTYRELLSDLYVSGKIRQLSQNDNIDLNEEFNKFLDYQKKKKLNVQDLDKTIENELQEKIIKDFENK